MNWLLNAVLAALWMGLSIYIALVGWKIKKLIPRLLLAVSGGLSIGTFAHYAMGKTPNNATMIIAIVLVTLVAGYLTWDIRRDLLRLQQPQPVQGICINCGAIDRLRVHLIAQPVLYGKFVPLPYLTCEACEATYQLKGAVEVGRENNKFLEDL